MRSVTCRTSSALNKYLFRTISSLSPGHILRGDSWNYRILNPVKEDETHISTVFKAQVIPREDARIATKIPLWALVKTALPNNEDAIENLKRERQIYGLPSVASAECFRKIYDVIDSNTITLEWLETTLAEMKYEANHLTYSIIMTFLRETLTSCRILADQGYVNTDYKTSNILLSGIETGRVTAKVGDLGLVVPVGQLFNAQPWAMRAPEVLLGHACTEPSQIWAVAAMLLYWIKPGVLGVWDCPHYLLNAAWSMAKILRLFPNWRIPAPDKFERPSLQEAVRSAQKFSNEEPELLAIKPLDGETRKVKMPQELRDLLRFMMVVDPAQRPSAASVLASGEFRAFERLVDV